MQIGQLSVVGILVLVVLLALWNIFEKADQAGWKAFIPVYNLYIMLKIAGKPGWWMFFFLIPGVNLIYFIWTLNMISKSFGKDESFTLGLVCFGFIFFPMLGFGEDSYLGPYGDKKAFEMNRLNGYEYGHQFA